MNHEDDVILKLTCATCDNVDCAEAYKYAPIDSLVGCTRWVPEEIYDQYIHYIYEVIPFWYLYKEDYVNQSYIEVYNFFNELYKKYPIAKMIDKKGKVIGG